MRVCVHCGDEFAMDDPAFGTHACVGNGSNGSADASKLNGTLLHSASNGHDAPSAATARAKDADGAERWYVDLPSDAPLLQQLLGVLALPSPPDMQADDATPESRAALELAWTAGAALLAAAIAEHVQQGRGNGRCWFPDWWAHEQRTVVQHAAKHLKLRLGIADQADAARPPAANGERSSNGSASEKERPVVAQEELRAAPPLANPEASLTSMLAAAAAGQGNALSNALQNRLPNGSSAVADPLAAQLAQVPCEPNNLGPLREQLNALKMLQQSQHQQQQLRAQQLQLSQQQAAQQMAPPPMAMSSSQLLQQQAQQLLQAQRMAQAPQQALAQYTQQPPPPQPQQLQQQLQQAAQQQYQQQQLMQQLHQAQQAQLAAQLQQHAAPPLTQQLQQQAQQQHARAQQQAQQDMRMPAQLPAPNQLLTTLQALQHSIA